MKLNLRNLKKQPYTTAGFTLEEKGSQELLDGTGAKYIAPVTVTLEVENTGRSYVARGKVHTVLELECSRCLEKTNYPIDTDILITLVDQEYESEYENEDTIIFSGDEAEIKNRVNEAIVMELPLTPLCADECLGLCPVCGVNRNLHKCKCEQEDIDPRWEKLKKLR